MRTCIHRCLAAIFLLFSGPLLGQSVTLVKDISPGPISSGPIFIGELAGRLIFSAQADSIGAEPWITDGTPEGTFMLADIYTEALWQGSFPDKGITYNGHFYFYAYTETQFGKELWRTDGTVQGTELFLNVVPGEGDFMPNPYDPAMLIFNDLLYFFGRHPDGTQTTALWRTDGTAGGTGIVSGALSIGTQPSSLVVHGSHLYFTARAFPSGVTLYRMDATGTLEQILHLPGLGARIGHLVPALSGLYFFGEDVANGNELWWTDGTASGTTRISDIDGSGPSGLAHNYNHSWYHVNGDTLLFAAHTNELGRELWRSDGTLPGTQLLYDLRPGPLGGDPRSFFALGDHVHFTAYTGPMPADAALWATDGTMAGTVIRNTMSDPQFFGIWDNTLYFTAGYPPQLHSSQGGTNDIMVVTTDTVDGECCSLVRYVARGAAGIFLNASLPAIGEELFLYTPTVAIGEVPTAPLAAPYPNPVRDHLFLDLPLHGSEQVSIHDAAGRCVRSFARILPNEGLPVGDLVPSMYVVRYATAGSVRSARFVKE